MYRESYCSVLFKNTTQNWVSIPFAIEWRMQSNFINQMTSFFICFQDGVWPMVMLEVLTVLPEEVCAQKYSVNNYCYHF